MYNSDATNADEIVIGEKPSGGQLVGINYFASHETPAADGDVITVPENHHDVLIAYVLWQGALARREKSLVDPSENNRVFDRMQKNPFTARLDYFTVLSQAQKALSGEKQEEREAWVAGYLKVVDDDNS